MDMGASSKAEQIRSKAERERRIAAIEYIRDFAEELALMADGLKLREAGRALQEGALHAHQAAEKLGAQRDRLRHARYRNVVGEDR